jgi:predicted  nucleic acid-binding Zn-ribbon protein
MDLLKQLEGKLQVLVQQRNQYREEAAALKAERTGQDEELHSLRLRLEDMQTEHAALQRERADVRKQVESILKMVEGLE